MNIDAEARAVVIARDNDEFRKNMGCAPGLPGRVLFTQGVRAIGAAAVNLAYVKTRDFAEFNEDNDPYGEHNFGAFDIADMRFFWRIDYYADANCEWGSEDPSDPARTFRVLTIMLASEY